MKFIFKLVANILIGIVAFAITAYVLSLLLLPSLDFVSNLFDIKNDELLRSLVAFGVLFVSLAGGICAIIFAWIVSSDF